MNLFHYVSHDLFLVLCNFFNKTVLFHQVFYASIMGVGLEVFQKDGKQSL